MSGAAGASAPKVSVVLPTYRRPEMLERALRAVFEQTLQDWELIVVDDNGAGSEAQVRTADVIQAHAGERRLAYVVHEENRGGGAARNTGIARARGAYVAFLDDDDAWDPDKLAMQAACLDEADERVALVYCRSRVVDESTGAVTPWRTDGASHTLRDLLRKNTIGSTSLVMGRRDALLDVGAFDERLPAKQDVDLYVRIAQRYEIAFVDRTLHTVYRHDGSSIGKDLGGKIRAHELFFEKYRAQIESLPEVHHYRLVAIAKLYAASGRYRDARTALARVGRLRGFDGRAWIAVALASRALRLPVRVLGRVLRSVRPGRNRPPREGPT